MASLEALEAQLSDALRTIIAQHGLAAGMQSLGRLMIAAPMLVPAAPMPSSSPPDLYAAPTLSPGLAPPPAPVPAPAAATPIPLRKPLPPAPTSSSPFSTATNNARPFSPGIPAAAAAAATGAADSTGDDAPQQQRQAQQLAAAQALPSSRTLGARLESVHTVPSASLSAMPSGVLSLVSPSAADEEEEAERHAAAAAAAASVGTPDSGGAAVPVPQHAQHAQHQHQHVDLGGHSAPLDVPRVVAAAVAAAAAAAAAQGGADGDGIGIAIGGGAGGAAASGGAGGEAEADSPRSTLSGFTRGLGTPRSGSLWHRAVNLSKAAPDPWAARALHALPMERAVRQRYNAHTGQWVTDEVLVKMEAKPFAAGAMRECYAAKKLSTFTHNVDWHKAQNMVAKRYKKEGVRKSVYYNDVLVQMDAKMLGECYNKTDPPKQVDVMQCAILRFPGRAGSPLYAVEQLIEGDYVKYNSNSGFVKGDDLLRNTPQAFSHFTWELTKGLKICVDIQGVGDLYTDPQLHTLDGEGYGEGNLGMRGMALFFRSHECNPLCTRLGLRPFDRCDTDVRVQGYTSESSASAASSRSGLLGPGGAGGATMGRTVARTASYKARQASLARRRRRQEGAAVSCAADVVLAALEVVPKESPESLVHLEVAKLYGEVVLLPELRPADDPQDCLLGGLFHILAAAQGGALMALCVLARAHCGIEPSLAQFAALFKAGAKQREFAPHASVAWRCALLAAERGVRGAALAVAAAYGSGAGLFGEEALDGQADPAQAARWYGIALALPDLLADGDGDGSDGGVIHEHAGEGEEEEGSEDTEGGSGDDSDGGPEGEAESDSSPQFEMSAIRPDGPGRRADPRGGALAALDAQLHVSGFSDLDLDRPGSAALLALRVPKLEDLRPSRAWLAKLKRGVEEEAAALPGASAARYEVLFAYGSVLLAGGPGLEPNPTRAAELLEEAAEAAGAAGKGKLAQRYYEHAAKAQALCE